MPERDCAACTRQTEWGCDAYVDGKGEWQHRAAVPLRIDDEEVYRCPRRPLKDDPEYWDRLLMLYKQYRAGHLLDTGAIMDQSARALRLFALLDAYFEEAGQEKADREARRTAKRK